MSVTVVQGMNLTTNIKTERIVIPWDSKIALLEPSETPVLTLLHRLSQKGGKSQTVKNFKAAWFEKGPLPAYVSSASADDTSGNANLTISDYTLLRAGHALVNDRTGEVIRVRVTPTSSTVAVVRGAGTTHAAILASDKLYRLGSAEGEGTRSPDARGIQETEHSNLVQLFKDVIEGSATMENTELYGEDQRSLEQQWHGREHKKAIDRAICFGEMANTTDANGKPLRMMKGLFSPAGFISSKRYDLSAGYTEADFDAYMTEIFEYGSDTKLAPAGSLAIQGLNAFIRDKLHVVHPSQDKAKLNYGMTIALYTNGYGTLQIVPAKGWKGDHLSRCMGVIDPKQASLLYQFPTYLDKNIQENDMHGYKDQWLTGVTCKYKNEETGAFFQNM